ncbi:type II toxin-antitoxin system VapC family toxin [Nocardiopsis valliformis]|uniref:type II toxin-antitoxin system VapC family toxin n=1 Tax=Nocardiopsis valliformis TaxID=239974 RepID=UPI0003460B5E|nr:type II toxin-antitoxin system VapC family toxin [Nocardiopsis valliformis]
MLYCDSAALVKLIRREQESDALFEWLTQRQEVPLASSALAEVEVPRALRRSEPQLLGSVSPVLGRVHLYEINGAVRAAAAAYTEPHLRSLDAIHLATAHSVLGSSITAFVTYDKRLLTAAEQVGLPVASPGV